MMQAMRTVVATALILLLAVFLAPMLFLGGPPGAPERITRWMFTPITAAMPRRP